MSSERMAFKLSLSLFLGNNWYCFTYCESFEEFLANLIFFLFFPVSQFYLLRTDLLRGWFSSLIRLDLCRLKERLLSSSLDLLEEWERPLQLRRLIWLSFIGVSDEYSLASVWFFFLALVFVLERVSTLRVLFVIWGWKILHISDI